MIRAAHIGVGISGLEGHHTHTHTPLVFVQIKCGSANDLARR